MVAAHLLESVTDSLCARVIPHYHIVVRLASVPGGKSQHSAMMCSRQDCARECSPVRSRMSLQIHHPKTLLLRAQQLLQCQTLKIRAYLDAQQLSKHNTR
jgi:hypothetical protein